MHRASGAERLYSKTQSASSGGSVERADRGEKGVVLALALV